MFPSPDGLGFRVAKVLLIVNGDLPHIFRFNFGGLRAATVSLPGHPQVQTTAGSGVNRALQNR